MERETRMKRWAACFAAIVLSVFIGQSLYASGGRIESGSTVQLTYSLDANGTPVISKEKQVPMKLVVGKGLYPAAFERQLIGLNQGDSKNIELTPEQGYGPRRPELLKRIPKSDLPPSFPQVEGTMIGSKRSQHPMVVAKVLEDSVILDQNHPLAGKRLAYHVRVTDVR